MGNNLNVDAGNNRPPAANSTLPVQSHPSISQIPFILRPINKFCAWSTGFELSHLVWVNFAFFRHNSIKYPQGGTLRAPMGLYVYVLSIIAYDYRIQFILVGLLGLIVILARRSASRYLGFHLVLNHSPTVPRYCLPFLYLVMVMLIDGVFLWTKVN